jgi:hypothetical protein
MLLATYQLGALDILPDATSSVLYNASTGVSSTRVVLPHGRTMVVRSISSSPRLNSRLQFQHLTIDMPECGGPTLLRHFEPQVTAQAASHWPGRA